MLTNGVLCVELGFNVCYWWMLAVLGSEGSEVGSEEVGTSVGAVVRL